MVLDAGSRLLVSRRELHDLRVAPDPDAPAARPLADSEARLAIEQFALTANNITYAAFGDSMSYWQFFPCDDAAWGCVPVWGYAAVSESRAEGIEAGRRVFGFLPMGTHLVVRPTPAGGGFVDGAAHRQALPAVYNQYASAAPDSAAGDAIQAVLRPLFMTGFLIDDFLADNGFFGARQVLLSSASSKTAYATAFCLARRDSRPRVVGLTSDANLEFTRSLGCYDEVLTYDGLAATDATVPAVYVDFAGSASVRRSVHGHFADALTHSCAVGSTHWDARGSARELPGPRPEFFFAPAQIKKRRSPPPEGWGASGLQQRTAEAWQAFTARVGAAASPWLALRREHGITAVEAAYRRLLDGKADPREGLMLSL